MPGKQVIINFGFTIANKDNVSVTTTGMNYPRSFISPGKTTPSYVRPLKSNWPNIMNTPETNPKPNPNTNPKKT